MAIIKTKDIYNIHWIHHSYRSVASILRANSTNKFYVFFNYQNAKKNAYQIVRNKLI
jgi:hypothetical protein